MSAVMGGINPQEMAQLAIEEMVHRETRAWDRQDAAALVELFHPDMVWPWPPTSQDHDPASWVFVMGRFDRERWLRGWQGLFDTHTLIHNRREIVKIVVTDEGDGGFAVVDVDTLWRDGEGRESHWRGRACKIYTRMAGGEWKLIAHTGVWAY
jgi:ketosteroid isomerase-like protein